MDYVVRLRIKIVNPSWENVYFGFIFRYIVPLFPLFRSIAKGHKTITEAVHDAAQFLAGVILFVLALAGMGLAIAIPYILFSAAMGWIK